MRKVKTQKRILADDAKIEILKQGKQTEFWRLLVEIMEESKEDIQRKQDGEDIAELNPEQYKFRNELFKAKKEMIDNLIKTPENVMSWLEKPETERQNFDPYDK